MAAHEYNPFEGPLCSFEEAILWVAHRDVAQILDASSLFSLREWPHEVTKGFWRLLRELARERQPIRSFVPGGQPVEAAFYRQVWSTLKAEEAMVGHTRTLPIDENLARRVDGLEGMRVIRSVTTTFRDFIRAAESILGFIDIDIDTDSLTQTFPDPDPRPPPVEPVAAAPFHKDSSEAPSKRSPMAMTASEAGHMGGTEAQKHRREAGELAWTADALRIAKDARVEDPHVFTKTICERIWNKCRFKGCPAPDEKGNPSRQLYRFIERHEATEDGIPKRTPYKERKAVRRRAR